MRIQYNVSAAIAMRHLTTNRSALIRSLEKLASGYAVNRAGDDAAGLAISEKMRRQITGLDRALKNSKEGANLIQTGEGALAEIHDMLNRAAALAEQSAHGTYDNALDRRVLQKELDQLCADISRIAESAKFNGIKLFRDKGLAYESGGKAVELAAAAENAKAAGILARPAAPRTLDHLLEGQETGELNIVYIEYPMSAVEQLPADYLTGPSDPDCDITIDGKKISEILKTQMLPQTVQNILKNYPAFSYLKDSAIGIGLRLYNDPGSDGMALASIYQSLNPDGTGYLGYALNVNMAYVDTTKVNWREELEATIAHEMIHVFMAEATTAGMIGNLPGTESLQRVPQFESWFIEGMAQTASGPGGWTLLGENSTDEDIKAELADLQLDGPFGEYGGGYFACMYLGWAIASGGNASTPVTATIISKGLSSLMSEVIGGKSLDTAIRELTGGKFTSTNDFKNKFNNPSDELVDFTHNLMVAKGSGRGALASGNLSASDLTSDADLSGVKLFELNTNASAVWNEYPEDYVVLTGGTTSTAGTKPNDFTPQNPPNPPVPPDKPKPDDPVNPDKPNNPAIPEEVEGSGIILQIGAEYGETLKVPQFYLSLKALGMENLDISIQSNAQEAMSVIKNAINRVSSIRGTYGALYNRLEHNQNQLRYMTENITDAESRIRDVDVAEEMMRYTKSNILIQSAQPMLAQANLLPQAALQMLS